MKKLISSRELYFEVCKKIKNGNDTIKAYEGYFEYLEFIYQSLELGQFIPCNEDGESMEKPSQKHNYIQGVEMEVSKDYLEYQKALESVLFEGWSYYKADKARNWCISNSKLTLALDEEEGWYQVAFLLKGMKTIEDLINSGIELIPTEACRKTLNL